LHDFKQIFYLRECFENFPMTNRTRVVSMTGFGTCTKQSDHLHIETEVRSVNSRYLDVVVRAPDEMRSLEPAIRELISQNLSRGKVEVRVNLRRTASLSAARLDAAALETLLTLQTQAHAHAPLAAPLSTADMLRWPGVVSDASDSAASREAEHALVLAAMREAVAQHGESRAREGAALADVIRARVNSARAIRDGLVPAAQRVRNEFPARLRAKIESSGVQVDSERLAQEIVLHAQRVDIDEELERLGAHFSEVERVLAQGGDVGKRLDFLMQELNREANTLGSKSVDGETTRGAIDLKVLIEQMREQVQNLQ
jgi:uncharacterized protein (TIGR00255 family)